MLRGVKMCPGESAQHAHRPKSSQVAGIARKGLENKAESVLMAVVETHSTTKA